MRDYGDMKVRSNSYVVECIEQHMYGYYKLESNRLDKPHTVNKTEENKTSAACKRLGTI